MNHYVIETEQLSKRYAGFTAVDSLNLKLQAGQVFGLLGPNGAGKTTTILMLLGLTDRSAGRVQVLGFDPARQPLQVKARVGYLPDQIGFYDELSARENLIYIAKLNGLSRQEGYQRIDAALERMGLAEVAHKPVRTFSRGMRQRLGVAEVLIKKPQVIIMDEPTLGLDPEASRQFLKMILDLKAEGITILLSSHLLHQVQAVCDRVGLFYKGKMALNGTVAELAQRAARGAYRVHLQAEGDRTALETTLRQIPGAIQVSYQQASNSNGAALNLYTVEAKRDLRPETAAAIVKVGGRLLSLEIDTPSLDEIYTQYFQEVERAEAKPSASRTEEVKHVRAS